MLNSMNVKVAELIAKSYCGGNPICAASVVNRLKRYFDDITFIKFLSTLRSKAYLTLNLYNRGYMNIPRIGKVVKVEFKWMDIISGETGSDNLIFSNALFEPTINYSGILAVNPDLAFIKVNDDNSWLITNSSYGYPIAYTTEPTTQTGTGGTITTGTGGTITHNSEPKQVQTGFNFSQLFQDKTLLYGIGAIGLVIVGKKLKWF